MALHKPESRGGRPEFPDDIDVFSMLVADALADLSEPTVLRRAYAATAREYEPMLENLGSAAPQSDLLLAMARAEAQFVAAQSRALRDALLSSAWGEAVEKNIGDEQAQIGKAKAIQAGMFFAGVATAGALAVAAPSVGQSVGSALIQAGFASVEATASTIDDALAAARSQQLSVSVEFGGEESAIAASNLSELRAKLRELYIGSGLASPAAIEVPVPGGQHPTSSKDLTIESTPGP